MVRLIEIRFHAADEIATDSDTADVVPTSWRDLNGGIRLAF